MRPGFPGLVGLSPGGRVPGNLPPGFGSGLNPGFVGPGREPPGFRPGSRLPGFSPPPGLVGSLVPGFGSEGRSVVPLPPFGVLPGNRLPRFGRVEPGLRVLPDGLLIGRLIGFEPGRLVNLPFEEP